MVDSLTKFTQEAFTNVFPEVNEMTGNQFLDFFKKQGFFLDDLCLSPVNLLSKESRSQYLAKNVQSLTDRIKSYRPEIIILIFKGIKVYVDIAIQNAESNLGEFLFFQIPFAGTGNQRKYVKELTEILKRIYIQEIID